MYKDSVTPVPDHFRTENKFWQELYIQCSEQYSSPEGVCGFFGLQGRKVAFPLSRFLDRKNPSQADFWTPLVDKIRGQLASQKCKALNEAGRLVLVKPCLDGIPNYWLNLHKIPKGVCKKIDITRRRFLWGELRDSSSPYRRLHLIKWSMLSQAKSQGGLGLRNLKVKNLAFLGKWWWRFIKERDKKWNWRLRSKYSLTQYLEEKQIRNPSPILKSILDCSLNSRFLALMRKSQWRWILGNGNHILFWLDI